MNKHLLTAVALSLALSVPANAQGTSPATQPAAPAVKVEPPKAPAAKAETPKSVTPAAKTEAAKPAVPGRADPKPALQKPVAAIVDLNTASQKDLIALPKIGKARSQAIMAGRPYKSVDDLVARKILSKTIVDAIKDKVVVK